MGGVVTRKNIRNLTHEELDNLISAFDAIQRLPPDDPNSFFIIAGYHGEPGRRAGYANTSWWGGYCNHGNVLFPTWHRAFVHRLERALQSQVSGVAMPYWDETEEFSLHKGIPKIFLQKTYTFSDNRSPPIPNPLFSYKFQARSTDRLDHIPDANYSKPVGYETVRFPFSGLVDDKDHINHNKAMHEKGEDKTNQMLNDNVMTWLNSPSFRNCDGIKIVAGVNDKFKKCLEAPNYTVFSNRTSANCWNDEHIGNAGFQAIVPLESPHDSIHLAIGGFDVPKLANDDQAAKASGDMGENDTAAFDPIFYFHHSFIDLTFWRWQVKHKQCDSLKIIQGYPGTNSVDNQGPGPWLTLDSPLDPFKNPRDPTRALTSNDVVNIANLGYTYEYREPPHEGLPNTQPAPILTVSNINRAALSGSFVISAWAHLENDKKILVGTEAVLSRRHVAGCQNCQNHLEVRAHFPMEGWSKEETENMRFEPHLHTRPQNRGDHDGSGLQQGVHNLTIKLWTDHL